MAIKFLLNSNAKNCFLANLPQVLLLILQKSRQVSSPQHEEGDLDKQLIKLMEKKIKYFSEKRKAIEALIKQSNYEKANDVADFVFKLNQICKDKKHYFQQETNVVKKLCKEFLKEYEQMRKNSKKYTIFNNPKVTKVYNKEDVIAMIKALNDHREETSGENYVSPFAPATAATSSVGYPDDWVSPMIGYHEKKKGWGIEAIVKLTRGVNKWMKKIKEKKSGSREKGETIHLGRE
uniref:Uncharacterized protein n=1 Tax=Meloidogyne enterolobii TaxID=390850 RepID=A0A6V7XBU7_MELEN|nr:unnamed protein product [Meloidogyne enterolobii]